MTDNPYAVPNGQDVTSSTREVQLVSMRTVGFILVVGGVGSVAGALIGFMLGLVIPDYYARVFGLTAASPTEIGLGIGTAQGFGCGIAVGTVLVIAQAWIRNRR